MKKLLLFTLLVAALQVSCAPKSDAEKIKDAVISQLLSNSENDQIIAKEAARLFPNGTETDLCLKEVVAYGLSTDEQAEEFLTSLSDNGSWSDIDYTDDTHNAWLPQEHLERLMQMARSYRDRGSKYYNSKEMLAGAERAVEFWSDGKFVCGNWWYNEIGIPKVLAPALLLLQGDISEEVLAKGVQTISNVKINHTGQNKVWVSGVVLIRSLITGNEEELAASCEAIKEVVVMADGEGIKPDYSFHQHGAQMQFGNYGLAFSSSIAYWMRMISGTQYDFTPEQKEIMRNYMLKGLNVTIWKGEMDVTACARQLFVNGMEGKALSQMISNLNMLEVDPEGAEGYNAYIERNFKEPYTNDLVGIFQYPESKYTVQRSEDWFFSLKMCSDKIRGGEITNRENLKGYHLSDGATFTYYKGDEYDNIFPIWDGRYMPGTTVALNDKPLPILKKYYFNGSPLAGGITDGHYGVSAMEYRRDGVEANKSWFFVGDMVIALGNGIKAESSDKLVTTLEQCHYRGATETAKGKVEKSERYQSCDRVLSDGVGYLSLDGAKMEARVAEQVGDWHDVADMYHSHEERGDIFSARFVHPARRTSSYAYAIMPGVEKADFFAMDAPANLSIEQNDSKISAVEVPNFSVLLVVFWQDGEIATTKYGTISGKRGEMKIVHLADDGSAIESVYQSI